jgi:hypothetical protein
LEPFSKEAGLMGSVKWWGFNWKPFCNLLNWLDNLKAANFDPTFLVILYYSIGIKNYYYVYFIILFF